LNRNTTASLVLLRSTKLKVAVSPCGITSLEIDALNSSPAAVAERNSRGAIMEFVPHPPMPPARRSMLRVR
jgi:hypothetical protein